MPAEPASVPLTDALREAVKQSGLSYNRLAELARTGSGGITNYMTGKRDMTLAVASRLCLVLGFGLVRIGPALTEPLAAPPTTNRRKPKARPVPASAVRRGQGRRVDLGVVEPKGMEPEGDEAAKQPPQEPANRRLKAGSARSKLPSRKTGGRPSG